MIDLLESRRLFTAVPIEINGTAGNDMIRIDVGIDNYFVTVNGVRSDYPALSVSTFIIRSGEGDDTVVITTGVFLGCYIDGGPGNDKLVGGNGADTILGGAGKDNILGGLGNDLLKGGGGNDKILGNEGADRIYGGDGNDYISGGSSGDRLYPGAGVDTVLGDGGNDFIFAIDGVADQLFGGSGTDTAHADNGDIRSSIELVAIV